MGHLSCWAPEHVLIKEMNLSRARCDCSGAKGFSIASTLWLIWQADTWPWCLLVQAKCVSYLLAAFPSRNWLVLEVLPSGLYASPSLMSSSCCLLSHSWVQPALYSLFILKRASTRVLWAQSKKKNGNNGSVQCCFLWRCSLLIRSPAQQVST